MNFAFRKRYTVYIKIQDKPISNRSGKISISETRDKRPSQRLNERRTLSLKPLRRCNDLHKSRQGWNELLPKFINHGICALYEY